MQKNKILKRIDRIIFQAIVMGDNLTADDATPRQPCQIQEETIHGW